MQGRSTVKSNDATHIRFRFMNNGPVRAVSLVVPVSESAAWQGEDA
jgi:hypothetical protein